MASLAAPPTTSSGPAPLFHLVPTDAWNALSSGDTYFPATYDSDGFTHLTANPALLLEVANHFYTDIPGDFVVLELDTRLLAADNAGAVKYEPAAPVGDKNTKAEGYVAAAKDESAPLFPHLYGGIPKGGSSVVGAPLVVDRDAGTGAFLSIHYPIAAVGADTGVFIASSAAVSDSATMDALVSQHGAFASLRLTSEVDAPCLPLAFVASVSIDVSLSDDDALTTELPIVECLEFLDRVVKAGLKVVVHSSHGVSRASSIVVALLMFVGGYSLEESLSHLRRSWSRASPRPFFMSQLSELEGGGGLSIGGPKGGSSLDDDELDDDGDQMLREDEIQSVIELDDDDAPPPDSDGDDDDGAMLDDDDAMRRAAEEEGEEEGAATTGLDQLPEEKIVEMSKEIFRQHTDSICCVAAHPTSTLVVSGGCDDVAYLWDVSDTSAPKYALGAGGVHKETVSVCSFNFDGTLVATGALDGAVCVWCVADGSLVKELEGPEEDVNWISWHPRGNVILAGSTDMLTWMWMATTGDCMQVFSGHSGPVTCGSFSPDGKFIVTASADGTAKVWNPKTGKCRHSFGNTGNKSTWHDQDVGGILSLAISADGTSLVTGGEDGKAMLASIVKKKERTLGLLKHRREGSLNGHVVECVGFNDVNDQAGIRLVFTAGSAGLLVVWDQQTHAMRYECRHTGGIVMAGFCSFAPMLWSCSADESACVWDSRSGALVQKYTGHTDVVLSCCAVRDERGEGGWSIVTTSDDKTCRVFYEEKK